MRTIMKIKVRKIHAQCAVVVAAVLTFVVHANPVSRAAASKEGGVRANPAVTKINSDFMITPEVALAWNTFKAEGGPNYAGSPAGVRFANFLISTSQALGRFSPG